MTDARAILINREYIRPTADQWARSGRTADEILKRDKAIGIVAHLQSLIAVHGPDALIADGRNDVTLADAVGIVIVGMVVSGYLKAPDDRMGGVVPESVVYLVAGSNY